MKRKLKRKNKLMYTSLLKKGRELYSKSTFSELKVHRSVNSNVHYFTASQGYGTSNIAIVDEATWSE